MEDLRKKGECIFAHEERKRHDIEQSQRELEEEWTRVLQTAREIKDQIEREDFLSEELKSFEDQLESTQAWIRALKASLQSKDEAVPAEEIINQAQVQKVLIFLYYILYFDTCILFMRLKMYIYDL